MVQQVGSEQPGLLCAVPQAPGRGQLAKPTQTAFAASTQALFQLKLQQTGSTEQTASQHDWSEQPGVPWTTSGEPVAGQLLKVMLQLMLALAAQVSSHAREQQVGSTAQINWQQLRSSQVGTKLGTEQGRPRGSPHWTVPVRQRVPALSTQNMSHSVEQQVGSTMHTLVQQVRSRQEGVPCGKKQLPDSTLPQPLQRVRARTAQVASHDTLQQVGSATQTLPQQAASEQPGPVCSTKQLPVAEEQIVLIEVLGVSAQFDWARRVQV
jgi:hypothetical protein